MFQKYLVEPKVDTYIWRDKSYNLDEWTTGQNWGVRWSDVLPVKGKAEEAQPLIAARTTEKIGEYVLGAQRSVPGRQTEYIKAIQGWEDICWYGLIGEHSHKCAPEDHYSLAVCRGVKMQRLK